MMLKFSIGIVVAMVVLGLPCASAADIIVNGGFENGFTGWSTKASPVSRLRRSAADQRRELKML